MIDRYAIFSIFDTIVDRYGLVGNEFTVPNYNAAPAQALPVISNQNKKEVSFFYWGTHKEWSNNKAISSKLLSAEKSQLISKTSFKIGLEKHRCLIPANGFYIWKQFGKKSKTPYYCFVPNQEIISLAGIWEEYEDLDGNTHHTFRIITRENYTQLADFGSDMPVIISREDEKKWLDSYTSITELNSILDNNDLCSKISFHPVSPHINNITVNNKDLIKPQAPVDQLGNYTLFG